MSNSLKVMVSAFLLFFFCISCGKEPKPININGVYVAGYEYNSQGKRVAKYWKDGVPTNLSDGNKDAEANSIYCTDKEVFVVGYETNAAGKTVAVVWKNGIRTNPNLTDGITNAEANSVYVSSQFIVMVAGVENNQARLWQNGVSQTLDVGDRSSAYSVFVDVPDNSTFYVAGQNKNLLSNNFEPVYWKNGKRIALASGQDGGWANSIFVSGKVVYVAGVLGFGSAVLWKNGIIDPIADYAGSMGSEAKSITDNPGTNEVWIAGTYYDDGASCCETHPTVWEAGETGAPIKLGDGLGLKNTKHGTAIFYPEKGQQYVAGYINNANNKSIAVYWHNLIMTKLTDGSQNAQAKSIFVKI